MSRDPGFDGVKEQAETYGLVLAAESIRYSHSSSREGAQRIRKAARWLVAHDDDDGDGVVGWGLPDAWDAFGDGSVNPPNHEYTISNALVGEGLLEALRVDRTERRLLSARLARRVRISLTRSWQDSAVVAWSDTDVGGYFWYSPAGVDDYFVPNVSSMWAGVGIRLARLPWFTRHPARRKAIEDKAKAAIEAVVDSRSERQGRPFWTYIIGGDHPLARYPNDLIHHAYILWGAEHARDNGIRLPWSQRDAARSIGSFMSGTLNAYPQDVDYAPEDEFADDPPRLWDPAMALLFVSTVQDISPPLVPSIVEELEEEFGPLTEPRLYPKRVESDPRYDVEGYFGRFGSHLLWGLARYLWPQPDTITSDPTG